MAIDTATFDIPKNPAQRRAWIMYMLRVRGMSLRKLAAAEGITHQAFSAAAAGVGSAAIQEVLAHAIGIPVCDLFSEHYTAHGRRLGVTRPRKRNGNPPTEESQKTNQFLASGTDPIAMSA